METLSISFATTESTSLNTHIQACYLTWFGYMICDGWQRRGAKFPTHKRVSMSFSMACARASACGARYELINRALVGHLRTWSDRAAGQVVFGRLRGARAPSVRLT